GGAREKAGARPAAGGGGQVERLGEVADQRRHPKARIGRPEQLGRRRQRVLADVDGNVGAHLGGGVEQQPGLDAGPAAKLDQGGVGRNVAGDGGRRVRQQGGFGAGGVIFLQLADGLEQGRAALVVEVFAR